MKYPKIQSGRAGRAIAIGLAVALCGLSAPQAEAQDAAGSKPNILLIISDDTG
ncbi:hypothetical protein SAMN05444007_1073 [Cribrihabitans marinus]|uniref:Arylsulfatase n=2 Tax=Cribrihabitans marinus TaxID=1227549 RepID=A0A1H7BN11_9RHOB|nr:hypothetical protein GCM10010973_27690 [Cribrihabitans marinus]SEJ75640.1 hypothetical protein SAMN05444007_1073 [Cribrihabitans marinus]